VAELILEANGQTWTLDPSRRYHLGRDPDADLVFHDARVSWRHALIRFEAGGWTIVDLGSTNGIYAQGRRVHHYELAPGVELDLGSASSGPRLSVNNRPQPMASAPEDHS
jgi:ABC transport system ATP-binding/permease protein